MTLPIFNPVFWRERYDKHKGDELHRAVYECSFSQFEPINKKHEEILARVVQPDDNILDAGCGYGRLLTLLPTNYRGVYTGVDLSPEFIEEAKRQHLKKVQEGRAAFYLCDLQDLGFLREKAYDLAITISIRQMVIANKGIETWEKIRGELRRVAKRCLHLEYSDTDEGILEG